MPAPVDQVMPDWLAYDHEERILTVDGLKMSRDFLNQITTSPCGVRYRIISRDDGVIVIGYERNDLESAAPALFEALKAMTEFWRYGLKQPDGMQPTKTDLEHVEWLASEALDALLAADRNYKLPEVPNASTP